MMDAQETRRLLELAAKAVGIEASGYEQTLGVRYINGSEGSPFIDFWKPHLDDGDSRRLEVVLRMEVDHNHPADEKPWVSVRAQGQRFCTIEEFDDESQRAAATRLAVLRAAAAIGESMQKGGEDGRYLVVEEIPPQELRENWMGDPPQGGFENYVKNHGQPLKFRGKA